MMEMKGLMEEKSKENNKLIANFWPNRYKVLKYRKYENTNAKHTKDC